MGAGSAVAWAVASRERDSGDAYDLTLLDDEGAARVTMSGVRVAPLGDGRASGVVNDWLYRLEWKDAAPAEQVPHAAAAGTWVIASSPDEFTGALAARLTSSGCGRNKTDWRGRSRRWNRRFRVWKEVNN
jgi:hypothetical protein